MNGPNLCWLMNWMVGWRAVERGRNYNLPISSCFMFLQNTNIKGIRGTNSHASYCHQIAGLLLSQSRCVEIIVMLSQLEKMRIRLALQVVAEILKRNVPAISRMG